MMGCTVEAHRGGGSGVVERDPDAPLLLFLAQIKDLGVKAGVVLNPGTSLTTIEEVGLGPCSTVPSN